MQCKQMFLATAMFIFGACVPHSTPRHVIEIPPASLVTAPESTAYWPSLLESADPCLQSALEAKLAGLGLAGAADSGRLAMALVDVTHRDHPRLAAVNLHQALYAASLPKIAILLGAMQKAEDEGRTVDPDAIEALTAMIRVSSNSAATHVLEEVGYDYVAEVLTDRYSLYDPALNGGLWVGKPYAKDQAWRRDPLHNLSHAATAYSVAQFYYLLDTGRLVSENACETMKEIMGDAEIHHKFVAGLDNERPGSKIYRKSGTWQQWHSDSALVERDGRRYIAVALSDHPDGGKWLERLIVAFDDLIFDPANTVRDMLAGTSDGTAGMPGGDCRLPSLSSVAH